MPRFFIAVLLLAVAATAFAAPVPASMQGIWAKHGRCDLMAERLTITADAAGYGKGPFSKVTFDPKYGAIEWEDLHSVDNFVIGRRPSVLIHNTQGFGMPGEEGMARCGRKLVRAQWLPPDIREDRNSSEKVRP